MFMGPLDASKPWNTRDVPGLFKLLQRIWRLVVDEETGDMSGALSDAAADAETLRALHKTIKGVTEDIEQLKFNTAIARMFEFVNFLTPRERRPREVMRPFVMMLSPFAPHIAEELFARLGGAGPGDGGSVAQQDWPAWDEALAKDDMVEIAVQVMGKVKARIMAPADADDKALEAIALADANVRKAIEGKTVRKVIAVKGRLVNIVAN
jgi:leucyl-tRNA synthetase